MDKERCKKTCKIIKLLNMDKLMDDKNDVNELKEIYEFVFYIYT